MAAESEKAENTAEVPAEQQESAPAEPTAETISAAPEAAPAESEPKAPSRLAAFFARLKKPASAEPAVKTPEESGEEEYTAKDFLEDAIHLAGLMMTAVFCIILLFAYVICLVDVEGGSMVPTLNDGDRLLVSRLGSSYETGDILILDSKVSYTFDRSDNLIQGAGLGKRIVKRLIAKGGQEINIDFAEGAVYVDGEKLDEPYINALTKRDEGGFSYPFTVPEGYVFVMGDNRNISKDSRHPEVGLLSEDAVVGKVILRIAPLSQAGSVG